MARYKFIADIERVTHSKNPNKSKQSLYLYVPNKLIKMMKTMSEDFSSLKKIGNCLPFLDGLGETLKFILAPNTMVALLNLSALNPQNPTSPLSSSLCLGEDGWKTASSLS